MHLHGYGYWQSFKYKQQIVEEIMEISKVIKEARIKKGMTQQQLADSVYVTRQTISKWELGVSQTKGY